jgi:hypothetical protein
VLAILGVEDCSAFMVDDGMPLACLELGSALVLTVMKCEGVNFAE